MSSPSTTIIINTIRRNKTRLVDLKKRAIRGGEYALETHNILWEEWKGECIDIKMRNKEAKQREKKWGKTRGKKGKKGKKVGKNVGKKCNFFEGQKQSVTHNQFRQTLQSLFVMGWKRENDMQTLSLMKRDKGTWK